MASEPLPDLHLFRPHPEITEDDAPQVYWSALAVVAWIGSRDLRLVAAVEREQLKWEPFRPEECARELWTRMLPEDLAHYCTCGRQPCKCFVRAARALRAALQAGRLSPSAKPDGASDRILLEALPFADHEILFSHVDGFRLLPTMGHLLLKRAAVLAEWPARDDNMDDETGPTIPPPADPSPERSVRGYGKSDAPLLEIMHAAISSGEKRNPWDAALLVVDQAEGSKEEDSRRRRLALAYKRKYFM